MINYRFIILYPHTKMKVIDFYEKYNPYIRLLNDLNLKISNIDDENKSISSDLDFAKTFNLEMQKEKIPLLLNDIEVAKNNIIVLEEKKISLTSEEVDFADVFSKVYKLIPSIQIGLSKNSKQLLLSIAEIELSIDEITESINDNNRELPDIFSKIERFNSVDIFEIESKLALNQSTVKKLNLSRNLIVMEKEKTNKLLSTLCEELLNIDQLIHKINEIISGAEHYQNQLRQAENSYYRREFHQECERVLGLSRPTKIIMVQDEKYKKAKRAQERILKNAEEIQLIAQNNIDSKFLTI